MKLNPAAPSFELPGTSIARPSDMPPTPPEESAHEDAEEEVGAKLADMTELPSWMLVEENEKLRVAALTLAKTSTRDEWAIRLRRFADSLAPGFNITSSSESDIGSSVPIAWKPLAIRRMPPPLQPDLTTHGANFTLDFIHNEFRGSEWSPGFYYIKPQDRREDSKITAYWILDLDLDPYLPKQPGEHGAKLTPFFNSTESDLGMAPMEEDYMETPVFIANNYRCEYRYYGHYSQTRFSDKLDYERMVDGTVPPFVLDVWAKNLTQRDTNSWVKDALRAHIWPKPTYTGPMPLPFLSESPGSGSSQVPIGTTAKSHDQRVQKAIKRYTEELQEWELSTKLKLSLLTERDVHKLFRAADADEQVGLRLWFEYLQCTSYDDDFYDRMVQLKHNVHLQRGYAEKVREREARGWKWQKVERVSGSGYSIKIDELCPPVPGSATAVGRKDSVMGVERGGSGAKDVAPEGEGTAVSQILKQAAEDKKTASNAPSAPCAPQAQTLPPHLRNKVTKPNTTSTAATDEHSSSAPGNKLPSPELNQQLTTPSFPQADLQAAKSMATAFTKAKTRHTGTARGRPNTPKPFPSCS